MTPRFYRIYFNRKENAPCVWSIDEGTPATEVNVQWVTINTPCSTRFSGSGTQPYAWVQTLAKAQFTGGGVILS